MNRKRIIFVQNVDFPQQGAIDIFYYAKYLARMNVEVTVICREEKEKLEDRRIQVIQIGNTSYAQFIYHAFFRISQIAQGKNIDYVYFFAQHPGSVILQFFVKHVLKIKTIYDVVSGPIGRGLVPFISKIAIQGGVYLSDKYIVLSKGLLKKLHLPKNKPHEIIGMGYDKEVFKPNKDINLFSKKTNEIIFTYIGTLNIERNLDIFMQAFIANIKQHENIKLYLIGTGSGEDKLKSIAGGHIGTHIFFLGKKEHKKIPDYINSSDILISYIPKKDYFEYQPPTKLIEYLACNKPVIATNTIAQSEILAGYNLLVHNDDMESTKNKIGYSIKKIELLQSYDYNGIVRDYDWGKLVIKIRNLIN